MAPFYAYPLRDSGHWSRRRAQRTKEMHYRSLSQGAYLCLLHLPLFNLADCKFARGETLKNEPDIRNEHIISDTLTCRRVTFDADTES